MKWYCLVIWLLVQSRIFAEENDCIGRLNQFKVESFCFQFPSIVHFDLTVLEEQKEGAIVEQMRYVGRQITGTRGQHRIDFVQINTTGKGDSKVWEHYLELSPSDRVYRLRLFGGQVQDVKIEEGTQPGMSPVDPFRYAISGGTELGRRGFNPIETIIKGSECFPGTENVIRNKGKDAAFCHQFEFDSEVPWKINRFVTYVPRKECGRKGLATWSQQGDIKNIAKKWYAGNEGNVKWTEVDKIGPVPCYVHSFQKYFRCNDITATQEFEGFFFGFKFDELDTDRYFDKSRMSAKFLDEDFQFARIEKDAVEAKRNLK